MSIAKLRRRKKNRLSLREGKGKIKKEEGKIIYSPGRGQKAGTPSYRRPDFIVLGRLRH